MHKCNRLHIHGRPDVGNSSSETHRVRPAVDRERRPSDFTRSTSACQTLKYVESPDNILTFWCSDGDGPACSESVSENRRPLASRPFSATPGAPRRATPYLSKDNDR
ncbi:hypothetical protein EVAR_38961_1 [Eumeta japonica]|uniref:Uncharacterized protein n=1 Tax=Eumeta variegata TaxID=151549 RepID=A0A4C1W8Z5_EUMVA|nr:hypothetical protein EVAR_38961_1 [Eumeta japonica]